MSLRALVIAAVVLAVVAWAVYATTRPDPVVEASATWAESGHADRTSVAFTHWDEDEPPVIPPNCAACHSLNGFVDWLGEDGTPAGTVEAPHPIGSVVSCLACHNDAAHTLQTVEFPSGAKAGVLDQEGPCLKCHQGLRSTEDVEEAIAGLDLDAVSEDLSFVNVHYFVAAATLMGGDARGAYQYDGATYAGRFMHVSDLRTCNQCHDPHSLLQNPQECSPCHLNVVDRGDFVDIREGAVDYDGDGSADEGIALEILDMHRQVYLGLQAYAREVIGTPLVYQAGTFPYFFVDTNDDGLPQAEETVFANQYSTWTPRALRVAYNYHMVYVDPGAYAHNARYTLQYLYDNLQDLSEVVSVPVDAMTRP